MQRYFALIALFLFSLPVGLSISGCATNVGAYCNGLGYGVGLDAITQTIAIRPDIGCATGNRKAYGKRKKKQRYKGEIPLHETSPHARRVRGRSFLPEV